MYRWGERDCKALAHMMGKSAKRAGDPRRKSSFDGVVVLGSFLFVKALQAFLCQGVT